MDRDSIYRRVLDISIQLQRLLSDINESPDQEQLGGCQTTLQRLEERRLVAIEQLYRDVEKTLS